MAINKFKEQILLAAQFSEAAYAFAEDRTNTARVIAEEHLEQITPIKVDNADCFVGIRVLENHYEIWVCFTGSNDRIDWRANSSLAKVSLQTGLDLKAHSGFVSQYRLLQARITFEIKVLANERGINLKNDNVELVFTGHSLGGALATLASVHGADKSWDTQAIVFASPRVFDSESGSGIHKLRNLNITRVEIPTDWVCDAPPRNLGYSHVGSGIWVDAKGRVTTEDRTVFEKAWMIFKRWTVGQFAWRVHLQPEYIRRLKLWIG